MYNEAEKEYIVAGLHLLSDYYLKRVEALTSSVVRADERTPAISNSIQELENHYSDRLNEVVELIRKVKGE